eukprot:jgi/Mesvir1/22828/Mv20090-RA.1
MGIWRAPLFGPDMPEWAFKQVQAFKCAKTSQRRTGQHAFNWALENFLKKTDKLLLVHVEPPSQVDNVYWDNDNVSVIVPLEVREQIEAQTHQAALGLANKLLAQAESAGITAEADIVRGDPRDKVVDLCERLHASALIIGSRGLGALKRTFVGSVSDYCVHHCHCPVIIVKMPESSKAADHTE